MGFFSIEYIVSPLHSEDWLYNNMNVLNTTEVHILKWYKMIYSMLGMFYHN